MGDRCYAQVYCRREDLERFEDLGFSADDREMEEYDDKPYILLHDSECNGGGHDPLHALADVGVPFYGSHGSGGEYSEACFAAADGDIAWPAYTGDGPMALIREDGTPEPSQVETAVKYYRLLTRAKELLGDVDEDPNLSGDHQEPSGGDVLPRV